MARPLRIGIDATCWWNQRGFGRFTVQLLKAMTSLAPEEDYTLITDRDVDADEFPGSCRVINARPRRTVTSSAVADGRRSLSDLRLFTRAVKRLAPDVFFFPAVYSFFPVPLGTRTVICFHDTIAEAFPEKIFPDLRSRWAWRAKVRLALAQSTRIMAISQSTEDDLIARFRLRPDQIDRVTEAADEQFRVLDDRTSVDATLDRLKLPQDRPYLLYVGGISPHKNLTRLLHAMSVVLRQTDTRLFLVGDTKAAGFLDNYAELEAILEGDPALRAACTFTGYVSDDDLVALYNGAHAVILPSLSEGFGLPAVEAMACGVPVLASRAGSLPEVVGDAGLFFDPLDETEMAHQISTLLTSMELRNQLAGLALQRAAQFSWRTAAELALRSLHRAAR